MKLGDFGFDYFKNEYKGKKYKKVKTFKSEKEADKFADSLIPKCKSKRFPPLINRVEIGLNLGYRFRVCVPEDVEM